MADSDLIDIAREIKAEAMQSANDLRQAFGIETDPELRLYEKMGFDDFAMMVGQASPGSLVDYIRGMEVKRMRRK